MATNSQAHAEHSSGQGSGRRCWSLSVQRCHRAQVRYGDDRMEHCRICRRAVCRVAAGYAALNMGLPYLTLGRLRPLHTNAAIFAFAGNAIFAAVYYSTQRLCKARMWSDFLGNAHFWGWQLIIVLAAITLPLGITQSKEYAELEWPIDLLIAVVWLGLFGTNFFMTLVKRRESDTCMSLCGSTSPPSSP